MDNPLEVAPTIADAWSTIQPPLSQPILDTMGMLGFERMTPVQATVIPLSLQHKDVVVEAVTGSGKTLAFAIPLLERLLGRHAGVSDTEQLPLGGIVIAPTRELARQIYDVFQCFKTFLPANFNFQLVMGGATSHAVIDGEDVHSNMNRDQTTSDYKTFLRVRPVIIVSTPGRLDDLFQRFSLPLSELDTLVLDEADRLLDLGFTKQLNRILGKCPKQRRTALFSATMTDSVEDLVRMGLRNPARVVVRMEQRVDGGTHMVESDQRTPSTLQIGYLVCRTDRKLAQLVRLIQREPGLKFIVYFATCACVEYFSRLLSALCESHHSNPIAWVALHGKMDPKKRTRAFNNFVHTSPNQTSVLLCTDVAARGLDLPDVDRVIQYDPPQDPKAFSHRCGRTARAGRRGRAVVLLNPGSEEVLAEYMSLKKVPMMRHPYLEQSVDFVTPAGDESVGEEDCDADKIIEDVRNMAIHDRDVYEKGIMAFVSWVRSYVKHELTYIFRVKELDLARAAMGFGLLKLPKMPELKAKSESELAVFKPWDGDVDAIAFADPLKEAKRQKLLKERGEKSSEPSRKRPKTEAWSKSKEAKKKRAENREKRSKKRDAKLVAKEKAYQEQLSVVPSDSQDEDDWKELQREERLAKKLRKGKISQIEFDDLVVDPMDNI